MTKSWYFATCVVLLSRPLQSMAGYDSVIGYVVNVGVHAQNMMEAATQAIRIATSAEESASGENRVEKIEIEETELDFIREELSEFERDPDGTLTYRSSLIYFNE